VSRPISLRALKHTCTLEPYTGMSAGAPTYGTSVALSRVRFEPIKQNAMTSLGDMRNDKFLLFFDCRNSLPLGRTFAIKDKITFGSQVLSVRAVTPCYGDATTVHHYEVNCA
jgi:hypothetical protein